MAQIRITEYGGYASGRPFSPIPAGAPIQSQTTTIGTTTSTFTLSGNTHLITVDCDGGVFIGITSSASTVSVTAGSSTGPVGSTGGPGQRIPASVAPFLIFVQPYSRVTAVST